MKTIKFKSFDGAELHCTVWDEVESPKAVVQICHGMAEHGGKYDRFAQFLNSKGYIVFADDHRAHGYTETDQNRGHREGFIFEDTLKDQVFIHNYLKKEYNLPQVFIGHSYGSFIGQAFYQQDIDTKCVMLLGSAFMPKYLTGLATILLKPLHKIAPDWKPKFVNRLSDKLFNLKYKDDNGPSQWITRDIERRKSFIDDPMCGVNMSINFNYSMIKGIYITNKKQNTIKINKDLPIALFSGDMDPIGGWGKKITKLYKFYKKQGVKDIALKLYEGGRHEILNEINYEEVFEDITDFIEKCLLK